MSDFVNALPGDLINSSYHGHVIYASLGEIESLLGNPDYTYSPDGKIQFEWVRRTSEGDIFTLYDWKKDIDIYENSDSEIEWNIGANNGSISKRVCDFIQSKLIMKGSL